MFGGGNEESQGGFGLVVEQQVDELVYEAIRIETRGGAFMLTTIHLLVGRVEENKRMSGCAGPFTESMYGTASRRNKPRGVIPWSSSIRVVFKRMPPPAELEGNKVIG